MGTIGTPRAVAVVPHGHLGDVLACLPIAAVLKRSFPGVTIAFIADAYTRALIESCSNIDEYLDRAEVICNPQTLAARHIDVLINPSLAPEVGLVAKAAGVPIRIGNLRRPATVRWANRFVYLRSRNVPLHIANYNLRYLRPLGITAQFPDDQLAAMLSLRVPQPLASDLTPQIAGDRFNLVVHPKSNRNGREWPAAHFLELLSHLPKERFRILVTGRDCERAALLRECPQIFQHHSVVDLMGRLDLKQFLTLLKSVDGVVASGTGPLHIAAAFGKRVLGLFPGRDRINTERWRPLGPLAEAMSVAHQCSPGPGRCPRNHAGGPCKCMAEIRPAEVARRIEAWLDRTPSS